MSKDNLPKSGVKLCGVDLDISQEGTLGYALALLKSRLDVRIKYHRDTLAEVILMQCIIRKATDVAAKDTKDTKDKL